ncbi:MAG TPA: hypothetical protein VIL47_05440 [Candidatus Bipolaricaulota bacterium]
MRKYVLMIGSLAAVLLIAFLGGMQLGQAQMYDRLIFNNEQNEVFVRMFNHDEFFIKRYRDDNRIGIVDSESGNGDALQPIEQRLEAVLSNIPGLDAFELDEGELQLFKLENFRWEDIVGKVLEAVTHRAGF